jgi:hypothetical protein
VNSQSIISVEETPPTNDLKNSQNFDGKDVKIINNLMTNRKKRQIQIYDEKCDFLKWVKILDEKCEEKTHENLNNF